MSIYIGYVYTDDDNPVHIMFNAIYKVYIMNKQQHDLVKTILALNLECFILLNGDNILFGLDNFTPTMEKTFLGLYEMETQRLRRAM